MFVVARHSRYVICCPVCIPSTAGVWSLSPQKVRSTVPPDVHTPAPTHNPFGVKHPNESPAASEAPPTVTVAVVGTATDAKFPVFDVKVKFGWANAGKAAKNKSNTDVHILLKQSVVEVLMLC